MAMMRNELRTPELILKNGKVPRKTENLSAAVCYPARNADVQHGPRQSNTSTNWEMPGGGQRSKPNTYGCNEGCRDLSRRPWTGNEPGDLMLTQFGRLTGKLTMRTRNLWGGKGCHLHVPSFAIPAIFPMKGLTEMSACGGNSSSEGSSTFRDFLFRSREPAAEKRSCRWCDLNGKICEIPFLREAGSKMRGKFRFKRKKILWNVPASTGNGSGTEKAPPWKRVRMEMG